MQNDKEILGLLKTDTDRGMDSLFDRYYKPLVVFAYAYLNDWAETDDWSGTVGEIMVPAGI